MSEKLMIDLQPFCSKDETRYQLTKPWSRDGYTWATDGRVLLRIPGVHAEPNPEAPNAEKLGTFFSTGPEITMPKIPFLETKPCAWCKGRGRVCTCDFCDNKACICDGCDGTGKIEKAVSVPVGAGRFSNHYLAKIATLPGLRLFPSSDDPTAAMFFIFDGGCGYLMGMCV